MGFENDFVNEDLVSFEIDGRQFKYKPSTGGDEIKWAQECLKVEDGQVVKNGMQTALCKLRNVVETPYSKADIKAAIGIEKEYKDIDDKEKDMLWSKTKSALLNQLFVKIQEIEAGNSELKKN